MKKYSISILISFLAVVIAGSTLFSAYGQQGKQAEPVKNTPEFSIARFVVAAEIKDKEPVGIADKFTVETEKVYCFLETKNITKDNEISFVWIYNQKEMLKTALTLKTGSRWRTHADKTLRALKGDWKVELRDASGKTLKEVNFKVE
ncbi:MAG: DUF2914 domain-containing protein [Smithella sp.]